MKEKQFEILDELLFVEIAINYCKSLSTCRLISHFGAWLINHWEPSVLLRKMDKKLVMLPMECVKFFSSLGQTLIFFFGLERMESKVSLRISCVKVFGHRNRPFQVCINSIIDSSLNLKTMIIFIFAELFGSQENNGMIISVFFWKIGITRVL